jgi:hypothetical protein
MGMMIGSTALSLLGAAGSYFGAREAGKGAEEAGEAQADALREAAQLQQQQFETTRGDYIPYAQLGSAAAPLLQYMTTGIMPELTPADQRMIADYNAEIERRAALPSVEQIREQQAMIPPEPRPEQYQNMGNYLSQHQAWLERYGPEARTDIPPEPRPEWYQNPAEYAAQRQAWLDQYGPEGRPDLSGFDPYTLANALARQQAIQRIGEGGGLPVSPLYDWQKEQITEDINRQLAARGRSSSTFGANVLSDAYRGLAAEESQRQYGRLLDLTNIGRGAQGSVSGFGAGAASGAGNALGMAGGALGAGQQQAANIRGSTYANLGALPLQLYSQYQYLNALQPRQQPQQQLPPPQQQQQPYYP